MNQSFSCESSQIPCGKAGVSAATLGVGDGAGAVAAGAWAQATGELNASTASEMNALRYNDVNRCIGWGLKQMHLRRATVKRTGERRASGVFFVNHPVGIHPVVKR